MDMHWFSKSLPYSSKKYILSKFPNIEHRTVLIYKADLILILVNLIFQQYKMYFGNTIYSNK